MTLVATCHVIIIKSRKNCCFFRDLIFTQIWTGKVSFFPSQISQLGPNFVENISNALSSKSTFIAPKIWYTRKRRFLRLFQSIRLFCKKIGIVKEGQCLLQIKVLLCRCQCLIFKVLGLLMLYYTLYIIWYVTINADNFSINQPEWKKKCFSFISFYFFSIFYHQRDVQIKSIPQNV